MYVWLEKKSQWEESRHEELVVFLQRLKRRAHTRLLRARCTVNVCLYVAYCLLKRVFAWALFFVSSSQMQKAGESGQWHEVVQPRQLSQRHYGLY